MHVIALCAVLLAASPVDPAPRTITPDQWTRYSENLAAHPEAAALRDRLIAAPDAQLLEASDEFLIDLVPGPRVKRALFVLDNDVAYGCPIHGGGRYVFNGSADPFRPYELTCSIGGETYPNADFPESGPPDAPWDEQGWLDTRETVDGRPNPTLGMRYHWNAHYAYWGRWMKLGPMLRQLAQAHVLAADDDPRKEQAGHAGAVLLMRLAAVFPHMERDDFDSAEWVQGFPYVVRIMDYVWEPQHTDHYAHAFDLLKAWLLRDASLLDLDYDGDGKPWREGPDRDYDGDGQVTTADLVAAFETEVLRAYGGIYLETPPSYSNATTRHMRTLGELAIVLDEPAYYEHARKTMVDHIATNWYLNDGAYYEGAIPGYGQGGVLALRDTVQLLRRFDPDLDSARVLQGYLFAPSLICQGHVLPNPDDSGGVVLSKLAGYPPFRADDYRRAYLDYGDPRLAQVLVDAGVGVADPVFKAFEELFQGYSAAEQAALQAVAGQLAPARPPTTVKRSGYAVLRGGSDASPFDVFIDFAGYVGSHAHYDMFNPIYYGFGYALVPDLGYPDDLQAPSRHDWVNHPLAHWTVTVDRESMDSGFERGRLELLVDQPGFQAFSASSPTAYPDTATTYRRTLCLIDTPEGAPLLIDVFDVEGGSEHLYSFHAPVAGGADAVAVGGGQVGAVTPHHTLQGLWHNTPVPYGQPLDGAPGRSLAYIEHARPVAADASGAPLRFSFPRGDAENTVLDLWMPVSAVDDWVLGEGRSAPVAAQHNIQLPYLIARRGAPGAGTMRSRFIAVLEARQGFGTIDSVAATDGGLAIAFRDGRRWTIDVAPSTLAFEARGGDSTVARTLEARLSRGIPITKVFTGSQHVALHQPAPVEPGALAIIENSLGRNTYYPVTDVEDGGNLLRLGDAWTDFRVASGYLTNGRDGNRIHYDPAFLIQPPIRAQARGGHAYNEAGFHLRVLSVEGGALVLDAFPEVCSDFPFDKNQDGAMEFVIYDFGLNDSLHWVEVTDSAG